MATDATSQLRRQVLALPSCAALDAPTLDAVKRASAKRLRELLAGRLTPQMLRQDLEDAASRAAVADAQREEARDAANFQAALEFQAELDALYEAENAQYALEAQEAAEDREDAKAAYIFTIGNSGWRNDARLESEALVAAAAQRTPPPDYVQLTRSPGSAELVASVTWRFEREAWRAQQRPAGDRPFLQIAFISDTHGAHGMLDKYMHLPEIAEADCLCICGDAFEHEEGPSRLDTKRPMVERDLAKWLQALPHRFIIVVSGNHDACFAPCEALALQGVPPPYAGEPGRAFLRRRGAPCLYLQDEAAVITLANGEEVSIYGTPWHPQIGGIFEYDPDITKQGDATGLDSNPSPYRAELAPHPPRGVVGDKLKGSWGAVGDGAHVVLCHGPPQYILDSIARKMPKQKDMKAMSEAQQEAEKLKCFAGKPVGCRFMLQRLREVQPCVMAFGHVHANQGIRGKEWAASEDGKEWRKALREGWAARPADQPADEKAAAIPVPYRRIAWGRDLSDVAAAAVLPPHQVAALQADLQGMLLVNAASLNATTAGNQHGLRADARGEAKLVVTKKERDGGLTYIRDLRPPIVVRVYPGERGKRNPPELLKLPRNYRFPEE